MNKSRLLGAVCACTFSIIAMSSHAASVSGQGTWETTLLPRSLDGDNTTAEAYYDKVLGITWLADMNYALTNQFGLTLSTLDIDDSANTVGSRGKMTWDNALAWIAGMNAASYGGTNLWRLPTMMDNGVPGCENAYSYVGTDCGYNVQTTSGSPPYPATTIYSEMASMSYDTLGNLAYRDTSGNVQTGWTLTNTGPFPFDEFWSWYWSGLEYAPYTGYAWSFYPTSGDQTFLGKGGNGYAWAVTNGDPFAPVPIPPALWLFGSGLLGLIGMARRKNAA